MDNFIVDLYSPAKYCKFSTLKDDLIQVRVVLSLRDNKPSEQLPLDLQLRVEKKAFTKATQSETGKKQQSFVQANKSEASAAIVENRPKGKVKVKVKDAK